MTITPDSVQELLSSEDFGQRLRAVNQMRQLDPAIAFRMIQTATADSNARVRYAAVSQLSTLGGQDLDVSLKLLRDRLLTDKEIDVRAAAADAIGALKLTAAFDDLKQVYHEIEEWLLQFSIIAALGELGEPRSFELLEEALGSTNELVKTAAIGSLGELGDRRAIPLLMPYVTHPDWQVRHRVVQALGRLNGEDVRSTLEQMANDPSEAVAQEARRFL
ncbi:MAG TPA: HEAT repeat domain-containing protein [Synechococcales cyanobacterium M55_K2018_004]|nr:HEAT repeat domain-containing protein [Synechococcales cyanobacterium M55_K2018_004]